MRGARSSAVGGVDAVRGRVPAGLRRQGQVERRQPVALHRPRQVAAQDRRSPASLRRGRGPAGAAATAEPRRGRRGRRRDAEGHLHQSSTGRRAT